MSNTRPTTEHTHRPSRIGGTFRALIRARITAGLLVVLPIYVTFLLVKFVFGIMRDSSQWLVEAYITSPAGAPLQRILNIEVRITELEAALGRQLTVAEFYDVLPDWVQWAVAILSVLFTGVILYAIGLFTANIVGRRLVETVETLFDRVPLVKTVYRASKQILSSFAGEQNRSFRRVALVPFPQEKMRCVGFITATFPDSETGEELATVFIPTTPNPTTGYLQILRRKELVELDWSVEDAVQVIMSGGILRPDYLTIMQDYKLGKEKPPIPDEPPPPATLAPPPPTKN